MEWKTITSLDELDKIKTDTSGQGILIFKHSTRCSISSMALSRLERAWETSTPITPYFLDLIRYREVSNAVEHIFSVRHESPQAILIKNGEVIHDSSHMNINLADIQSVI